MVTSGNDKFEPLIICPHHIAFTPGMISLTVDEMFDSVRICKIHDSTVGKALCNNLRSRV